MGGGAKQFGVDAERVPAMLSPDRGSLALDFEGFHIFSGSQNLKAAALQEAHEKTLQLGVCACAACAWSSSVVEYRRRFRRALFPWRRSLGFGERRRQPAALVPGSKAELPEARIVIELGRYMVAEAGIYVCRVLERKESRGQIFLITDGGLHHHLAASGNFGQVIRKNYPVIVGNKAARRRKRNSLGSGAALHAAGFIGGPDGNGQGGSRRFNCRFSVRRLWPDRKPDSIPQPSRAC